MGVPSHSVDLPVREGLLQFNLRILLIAITVLAMSLGFRRLMSVLLPAWRDLETRIAAAPANIAKHGQLHGKGYSFEDWYNPAPLDWWIGFILLIVFYAFRSAIVTSKLAIEFRVLAYTTVVFAFLPFLYLRLTEWGNGLIYFSGNWIFMPCATLLVPTVFFVFDLSKSQQPTLRWQLLRSAIELLILTPVWYVICVFLMLLVGLAWL